MMLHHHLYQPRKNLMVIEFNYEKKTYTCETPGDDGGDG